MEEMIKFIAEYGVMIVIVGLFLYAWWDDRHNRNQILDNSLKLEHNNNEILNEMKKTNANTAKSLELLQISMENQTEMLKRHDEHFNDGLKVLIKDVQSISSRLGRMKE
mgnify:CR=1 FL=1